MAHREQGYIVLDKIMAYLGDKVGFEREAKFEGRSLTAIIGKAKTVNGPEKAEAPESVNVVNQPSTPEEAPVSEEAPIVPVEGQTESN